MAMQIFHPVFWINDKGEHPAGGQTIISPEEVEKGVWWVNPEVAPNVAEALFFHNIARRTQTGFELKGMNPLTEHYSALRPEVLRGPNGEPLAKANTSFVRRLLAFDALIIAGQAKSHCVAWTVDDLLADIREFEPKFVEKVYLLEDCTSPVVIPDGPDFTDQADETFQRFADAGMHRVRSTEPVNEWPGFRT